MGKLKNIFQKNKGQSNAPVNKTTEAPKNVKAMERKNERRRFSLLVEDAVEVQRLQGIMVLGTIHGKIKEGDTVYVYQSSKPPMELKVLALETGPRVTAEIAKNQKVGVCLNVEDKELISRYSVLSSVSPREVLAGGKAAVENPRLLGLTMEYQRLHETPEYFNLLLYELCYARFAAPFYMDQPPIPSSDGTVRFAPGAKVGIPSLKKSGDETKSVFPVFTDLGAMWNWKDAFHEDQPRQTVVLRLPEVISFASQGHDGIVINAFGPVPVYLPLDLLEQVAQTEMFKKLFEKKEAPKKEDLN
ncbi:MAG: SseB family protein [Lachnospiraceae bacterium]|nr:SseB family protein [Lachnospiraceae bacterium]